MDYEQGYYDLLYKNKSLRNKIIDLENDINLLKNKKYLAIVISYNKKIIDFKEKIIKAIVYNQKILNTDNNYSQKEIAKENLKILNGNKKI